MGRAGSAADLSRSWEGGGVSESWVLNVAAYHLEIVDVLPDGLVEGLL